MKSYCNAPVKNRSIERFGTTASNIFAHNHDVIYAGCQIKLQLKLGMAYMSQ